MKVLITVGIFPPDIGGPASFVPKIANILTENGYEVIVVCLSDEKIEDFKKKNICKKKEKNICNICLKKCQNCCNIENSVNFCQKFAEFACEKMIFS